METGISWSLEYIGHVCIRKTCGKMRVDLGSKAAVHLITPSRHVARVLPRSNSRLVPCIELPLSWEKC